MAFTSPSPLPPGSTPALHNTATRLLRVHQHVDNHSSLRKPNLVFAEDLGRRAYQLSSEYYHAPSYGDLGRREWAVLIIEALRDAAGSIHTRLQQQGRDEEFWLHVAHHCLYYSVLYQALQGPTGRIVSSSTTSSIAVTADELVRCWVAEDLLLSPKIKPIHRAAADTGKKQSNYDYRSAYEAGKIVIQALQEYSLLPIYSLSTSTGSTSTGETITAASSSLQQDVITGVSKLAEGVPRLQQEELFDHEKSNRLRWVSFKDNHARHVSWDWSSMRRKEIIRGKMMMSTLILRGCSNISGFPFHHVLKHHLRVLDLSYTAISSLPSWFSKLLNLRLLSLRGCSKLEILSPPPPASETPPPPPPLAYLGNLQVLDMNGAPLLELTQQDASNKSNLHYLDLSGSKVITLPSEFFREISNLEELILGNCSNLKELPLSLAKLSNLLILHIEGTQITSFPEDTFEAMHRLHTLKLINNLLLISLPSSLSKAKGLRELHISNCSGLKLQFVWELLSCLEDLYIQAWEAVEDIKIHGHPSLRTFSLSGPLIRCLSLRGCSRLKSVHFSDDLTALEDVDLSGTALEEIPQNLPNFPKLRTLLLVNVPYFKRFPWHQLVRIPKVFCLDHCADHDNHFSKIFCKQEIYADEGNQREETNNTAQIILNDSRIFHSFNEDAANKLVREGQFLQSFNVQVQPSSVRGKEPQKKQDDKCTKVQSRSPYIDVNYSDAASIVAMMKLQPKHRHVEISANSRYPHGLRHLLSVTNSIFITDDDFVGCLTDLNYSLMWLEECQLQHCRQMTVVFRMHSQGSRARITVRDQEIRGPEVFSSLKILQASNLNNLRSFVEPSSLSWSALLTLKLLKYIHLEHCPRLEKMFPCSLSLPVLETLVILFCSDLKTIFYRLPYYKVAPSPLPNIKRIYLQELPQLQHLLHDDVMFQFEMPKWEKLFVRGCHSFHHLPLLKKEYPKSKVEVSGERDWWDKLQWSLPEQREHYAQEPPPEFASRKKNIVIRTYLR